MPIELTLELVLMLAFAGLVAGCIDAIAGGGGMIALPMLLFAGLSPAQALATNKLQGSFGTFSASLYFIRRGLVQPRRIWPMVLCTFAGAALGTILVQMLDPSFLTAVIPLLLILIALYFLFSPQVGEEDVQRRIGEWTFALTVGFGVGFYDGFFGPGTGSFFAIAFVSLLGFGLTKATAHTKVLNLTSNLASLLFFIAGGQVVWTLGLVMAAGQLIGGRLGASLVVLKGSRLIRPLVVTICILMSVKLLLE
ncbi:TSUP family transporter [Motiliproteus sp. SC1-56]|uniref:TSUP family transporter n=1 Tax=Motiliproteus sp. SC1-56 TaxID=2799565 RepID=UPI001F5D5EBB|nr:TSUP family transporter [Motiliproteus sp. SC1-56]